MKYEVIDREGRGGSLELGENVRINRGVSIDISADVVIGNNVSIGEDVLILTHDHPVSALFDKSKIRTSSLMIEDGVFIGARAIINCNVKIIGAGAYLASGVVLTKDVPGKTFWAGNPAKLKHIL